MIIREWHCRDCDAYFESSEADPQCPECSKVDPERVFLTAPAIKSGQTATKDSIVKSLAKDYGLSDMSNKYGGPVMQRRGQVGPSAAHAKWENNIGSIMQKVSGAPAGIVDGPGFSHPKPQYIGRVK